MPLHFIVLDDKQEQDIISFLEEDMGSGLNIHLQTGEMEWSG